MKEILKTTPENLTPRQLQRAVGYYRDVVQGYGIVIGIGVGLTADLWPANPYLATLGILLSAWGFASLIDVRQKIISFSQEAKKRDLIVEGRTFLTKRIKL